MNKTFKAAFTLKTQYVGGESVQRIGGPCLNYIAIQLERGQIREVGFLAVYRNHDFTERSYGNYWGLCNLLHFIAEQTNSSYGPLTCISSHAYISREGRKELNRLINLI